MNSQSKILFWKDVKKRSLIQTENYKNFNTRNIHQKKILVLYICSNYPDSFRIIFEYYLYSIWYKDSKIYVFSSVLGHYHQFPALALIRCHDWLKWFCFCIQKLTWYYLDSLTRWTGPLLLKIDEVFNRKTSEWNC